MQTVTVLTESGASEVGARLDDGRVRIRPNDLEQAIGWHLEAQGLCRGDVCVPATDAVRPDGEGLVDLVAVADQLRQPTIVDADAGVVVMGVSAGDRRQALTGLELREFALPGLDGAVHSITEWRGRKKLLAAFASW